MARSNGLRLNLVRRPLFESSGWQVRVRDLNAPGLPLLAVVTDVLSLTISCELNAAGAGSVRLDRDTNFWRLPLANGEPAETLLDYEYLWEAYQEGHLRFQWIGRTVVESIVAEDETRAVTVSGPGLIDMLKTGVVLRPGYPRPLEQKYLNGSADASKSFSYSDDTPAVNWQFPAKWPTMRMWHRLFTSAKARGCFPYVNLTFSATRDSSGNPWEYVPTIATEAAETADGGFKPTRGTNLGEFLDDCTGQDYSKHWAQRLEYYMRPGIRLDVRPTIGADRTKRVVFFEGVLASKSRTRTRDEIYNYVVVEDRFGDTSLRQSKSSQAKWGRREIVQTKTPQVTDADRRGKIADVYVQMYADEKSEWVVNVPYDTMVGRRPFYDYDVGDWIGIARYVPGGGASVIEGWRVLAISLSIEDEVPMIELTLQSKVEFRMRRFEKKIDEIVNNVKIVLEEIASLQTQINQITAGGGTTGGNRVFIQGDDPALNAANNVKTGDFWVEVLDY